MRFDTLKDRLNAVRDSLNSLKTSPDGEKKSALAEKRLAKKRALEYLTGGLEVLRVVGPEMTAAVILALYPEHVSLSVESQTRCNEHGRRNMITGKGLSCLEVNLDDTTQLFDCSRGSWKDKAFCMDCFFLASQVMDMTNGELEKARNPEGR